MGGRHPVLPWEWRRGAFPRSASDQATAFASLRRRRQEWCIPSSSRSIQAKGISPDIEVLQDVPDELKSKTDTKGEASLRGHLKGDEGKEQTGSQSYIPPDAKNDKALNMALDLLRGTQVNSAFPPNSKTPVPN